ncbi:beta-ketoacyl-ACP reductase [Endomicrobiia bacterium]|uniref:3-oxoacyl-[acyl-carrier-protein] reductase n=1 Tax=Endomicrobium trichonymphae TaxID=1408204 RepID=B1H0Q3_ENDTX|nr:3-oxoacyl-[acyl-carrier-protein] reductase [Candidatus Endomicrobium trichonymphae]GHT06133.1 beta-ketoacyl-ACP reductase [Endomicrobiia bacterium]BAG14085.1 3-oxoacyl-[acyl-carrier-protein] reductase [Candidatus Endomicrobium trichonymphae]BAV59144.1 3-oxoacyl-[acyl-carrier-protein] reductase [Candidatus Endomicrobium trichonymphae]GHT09547.1 beta-ketoacyl-ACP reductase [Endomicrobiia bacterium]GHT13321.1 beta-ketoacyl-ACP reductase [Endomicrobiia bacterium]
MKLQGKVAVITGSAQGIGRSIAEVFASEGSRLVISDINIESAQKTADEIKTKYGFDTIAVAGNVSKLEDCEDLVKTSIDKFSKIDILINNAGITKDNLVLRMSESEWDSVIAVNLKGVFNCIKAVSKIMLKQRQGRIINISSVVGQMGNAGQINYSASKGGVIAITKTCAREFASRNILVNAIAPGFIRTAMTDKLTEGQRQMMTSIIPLVRLGEVSDIAKAALFLASDDSSYITGHVLSVNGGMYM